MKRRARERLPKRSAGAFPSFLYKSLDELEGVAPPRGKQGDDGALLATTRAKPLLILSDFELDEALLHRVGLPWVLTLTLQRLRAEPLREGIVGAPGDILRNALRLGRVRWNTQGSDLEEIAASVISTLPSDDDYIPLLEAWSRWKES